MKYQQSFIKQNSIFRGGRRKEGERKQKKGEREREKSEKGLKKETTGKNRRERSREIEREIAVLLRTDTVLHRVVSLLPNNFYRKECFKRNQFSHKVFTLNGK